MPRGFMDDLEGKVVGEEVYKGGFENRLGLHPTWVRIPHPPPYRRLYAAFFFGNNLRPAGDD